MDYPSSATELESKAEQSDRVTSNIGLNNFFQARLPVALRRTSAFIAYFFQRLGALVVTAVKEFLKDECLNLAAQISYFALFSVFPLIMGIILLISFFYDDPLARATLIRQLTDVFPSNTVNVSEIVGETLKQSQQFRSVFGLIFFIGLIWGGTSLFDALTNALNKAWQIPGQQRSIKESLILRFTMFGIFILLLVGSIGVSIAFDVIKNFAQTNNELKTYLKDNQIWDWLALAIPWGLNFVTFMLLYRIVPQRKVTFADVWPGALITTALFELVKIGFTFYVTQIARYSATYGSLAGVIVFIFWLYLIAVVLLLGGEFSSVYAEMRGDKHPTKLARQGHLTQANPAPPSPTEPSPEEKGDRSLDYAYVCEEIACSYVRPTSEKKS